MHDGINLNLLHAEGDKKENTRDKRKTKLSDHLVYYLLGH